MPLSAVKDLIRRRPSRWLAVLACLACLARPGLVAADAVRIAIEPPAQTLQVGATATVSAQVSGSAPVYGVELHLRFDPALLEVVDADAARDGVQVEPGTLFSGKQTFTAQNAADNTAGTIDYAVTLVGEPQAVAQGGPIAVIRFRGRAAGQASITIREALVADPGGLAIAVSTQDGSIAVAGGEAPRSTSPGPTPTAAQPTPAASATSAAGPSPATASPTAAATAQRAASAATPLATATAQPATPRATVPASAVSATATAQPTPASTRTSSPPGADRPARSGSVPAAVIAAALVIAIGALAGLYLWRRGRRSGPPSAGA